MQQRDGHKTVIPLVIRTFCLLILVTIVTPTLFLSSAWALKDNSSTQSVAQEESSRYAVNLVSSDKPIEISSLPVLKEFDTLRVYKTKATKKGKIWYRLRLGFFATQKDASKVLTSVRKKYPDAWVTKISLREREGVAMKTIVQASTSKSKKAGWFAKIRKGFALNNSQEAETNDNKGAKFNHDKTGFILIGAHTSTRCESCHARGIFKGTPNKCINCHSKSGQIAATSKPISHIRTKGSCDQCHTQNSWFRFVQMDHAAVTGSCLECHNSRAAEGKTSNHIASSNNCEECHSPGGSWASVQFDHSRITTSCYSCHRDKGSSHIASSNNCEECHSPAGSWSSARFDHTSGGTCNSCHTGDLPSSGHIATSAQCDACHRSTSSWTSSVSVDHGSLGGTCNSCHTGDLPRSGHISTTAQCDACHGSTSNWESSVRVDHGTLGGTCNSCHTGDLPRSGHISTTAQ